MPPTVPASNTSFSATSSFAITAAIAGSSIVAEKRRQHRRHTAQNRLVQHCALREVGDLRRPADVSRRRQNRILKHRPQQRIRTQPLRLPTPESQATPPRSTPSPPAFHTPSPAPPQSLPLARLRIHQKQQRSPRLHQHLRVIARSLQLLRPSPAKPLPARQPARPPLAA